MTSAAIHGQQIGRFFGSFSHNFEDFDHEDVARGDNSYYLKLKFSS